LKVAWSGEDSRISAGDSELDSLWVSSLQIVVAADLDLEVLLGVLGVEE